jgi:hypothetical protein
MPHIKRECWIRKNVEGSGRGLFAGTIPAVAWRDWQEPRETSLWIASVPAEIQTRYIRIQLRSFTALANLLGVTPCSLVDDLEVPKEFTASTSNRNKYQESSCG